MTDINKDQYEKYLKFKEELVNLKIEQDGVLFEPIVLLRFLRARKFDIQNTMKMVLNCIEWRKNTPIEKILN